MSKAVWERAILKGPQGNIDAWCIRSNSVDELTEIQSRERLSLVDETLLVFSPPSVLGEPVGFAPDGSPFFRPIAPPRELWRVSKLGSFEGIRFAKEVFGAPSDDDFQNGPEELDEVVAALNEPFSEGEFAVEFICSSFVLCGLAHSNATVTRKQRQQLDTINNRYFRSPVGGRQMKSKHASSPDSFVVGACW